MSHTPGPWHATRNCIMKTVPQGMTRQIHQIAKIVRISKEFDEANANARLMAAAPELLEALKRMVERHYSGDQIRDATEIMARAAIAKAEISK